MNIAEIDKIIGRQVSDNVQRTDSRYYSERNLLIDDLSEKGILDAIAIHEAGHEHYYKEAGGYGFEFIPPVILFRKDNYSYPFKRQLARIAVGGYTPNEQNKDWFLKLAKGYAAGGVCSSSLPSSRRYGDKSDRDRWDEMCADCYKSKAITEEKLKEVADETWNDAQKEIRKELENPTLRTTILNRATEIKPLLFPWLLVDSHS